MTVIDGYNLLHVAGVLPRGLGPGAWERARTRLLNVLAESLADAERARTIVVFDATFAPPGLPSAVVHRGLDVRYAANHDSADDLIEELIRRDSAPKQLTVVSADHRLQVAARRRKAKAIDSDVWFGELLRRRRERARPPAGPEKPVSATSTAGGELSPDEIERWVREFASEDDALAGTRPAEDGAFNPFPPGYAEDLFDEKG
jgi:predicted RNA-binding protein with PIN domain